MLLTHSFMVSGRPCLSQSLKLSTIRLGEMSSSQLLELMDCGNLSENLYKREQEPDIPEPMARVCSSLLLRGTAPRRLAAH